MGEIGEEKARLAARMNDWMPLDKAKYNPRVPVRLIIHWIWNHWQILGTALFLESLREEFRMQPYPSRLAILPVSMIPPGLGPVYDRCYFKAPVWR